jgi:hypothetical protein
MPARRTDPDAVIRAELILDATDHARAWDELAAAGASVARKQEQAWANVHALESADTAQRRSAS